MSTRIAPRPTTLGRLLAAWAPPSATTALLSLSGLHAPLSGPSAGRVVRSAARFLSSSSWECPPALAPDAHRHATRHAVPLCAALGAGLVVTVLNTMAIVGRD
ncbi:hypothetical protein BJ912DRAFT_1068224 [Pholiota molesta]|nr:hypothetical protein BJ912DRAFT_1068224 [Pholiota molesta]